MKERELKPDEVGILGMAVGGSEAIKASEKMGQSAMVGTPDQLPVPSRYLSHPTTLGKLSRRLDSNSTHAKSL